MIRSMLSLYSLKYPKAIVYMLQSADYMAGPYLAWFWRTNDFSGVARRRNLDLTRPAKLLLFGMYTGIAIQVIAGAFWIYQGVFNDIAGGVAFGIAAILAAPIVWAHLIVVPLFLGRKLIIEPKERSLVARSKSIFANHTGVKIAVAGSYGKTSMKELLATVLQEGKKVAFTPGNKNVAVSHAAFAARLKGDDEVLIIEYGEGKPGDVSNFARITQPDMAIITGLAPAHLDQYGSVEAAARDIFSLDKYLNSEQVYVNQDSALIKSYLIDKHITYGLGGCGGWKASHVTVGVDGIEFRLKNTKQSLQLKSGLLGRHQIGALSVVAVIALKLGLSKDQVEQGIAKTLAYEHRMQPRKLNGALIIDDTYNGNLEGVRAGTALLKELPARRKLYITPGLVDQGDQSEAVHVEMGQLIAGAAPDEVVLMKNSVTAFIEQGLENRGFTGKLRREQDPLAFYTNIEQFVAAGDIVLMQNDWTDNYA